MTAKQEKTDGVKSGLHSPNLANRFQIGGVSFDQAGNAAEMTSNATNSLLQRIHVALTALVPRPWSAQAALAGLSIEDPTRSGCPARQWPDEGRGR